MKEHKLFYIHFWKDNKNLSKDNCILSVKFIILLLKCTLIKKYQKDYGKYLKIYLKLSLKYD